MTSDTPQQRVVFVAGATGRQGGAVARHLLQRGFSVRALTRQPAKPAAQALARQGAQLIQGDLDNPDSYRPALEGAYGVFSVQDFWSVGYEAEIRQGKALADAAADAGVRHLVYSSVASADRNSGLAHFESKWQVEQHLRSKKSLSYTVLRPVFFMDNWERPSLRDAILGGTLPQPLSPDTPLQQIATDDIGAFAALAFAEPQQWARRTMELAGDELTMIDTAATFARVIGRPVRYVQVPWEQFSQVAGEEAAKMYRWFEQAGYEADIAACQRLHPELATLEQYLRRWNWSQATITAAS
ncbi:MAG TPA: NmrA/HSCARG family protein [Phycisphaeraceae bacterium]